MPLAQAQVAVVDNSAWHTIFDASTGANRQAKGVVVGCNPDSTGTRIDVRISPIHDSSSKFPIYKGGEQSFESDAKIEKIEAMAVGGDCLVDWGVFNGSK